MTVEDVQALIDLFLEFHPEYADPDEADGNCGLAYDELCELAVAVDPDPDRNWPCHSEIEEVHFIPSDKLKKERAIEAFVCCPNSIPTFSYRDAPHEWYLNGCKWPGHVVARIGRICIDFTARQFDHKAPFPLVFESPWSMDEIKAARKTRKKSEARAYA